MSRHDGRVALVTGAARGFGRAIALALGREGAAVAVNYRASGAQAEALVAELRGMGRHAAAFPADVASEPAVRDLVRAALAEFGRLDILVNNAGVMVRGAFLDVPVGSYAEMFAINVTGTMLCTRHALPAMIERRWGRVINLSSQLGTIGGAGFAAYAATKGAVDAFTKSMAREAGPHGITVNAIAPGSIETDMSRDVMAGDFKARRVAELPVRRMGSVEDVAHAAAFLASEASGFLTGQILHVNGGLVTS